MCMCVSRSVVSDSLQPHGLQPARLPVHGISQAITVKWGAMSSCRQSPQARDWTQFSCITVRFFTISAAQEALYNLYIATKPDSIQGATNWRLRKIKSGKQIGEEHKNSLILLNWQWAYWQFFLFFQPNRSQCNLRTKSGNWVPSHFARRVERISIHSERGQKGSFFFFLLLLFLHFFTLLKPPGHPALAAGVEDRDPAGDKTQREEHVSLYFMKL